MAGHIVQFRITGQSSLSRRYKVINLLDAYVCSGYLAAQHLPSGQFDPDSAPLARRYQDGLESDEHEEDTLFVLWYRSNTATLDQTLSSASVPVASPSGANQPQTDQSNKAVKGVPIDDTASSSNKGGVAGKMDMPPLNAKRKLGVFRTRSKLERDAWVWAINAEIDKTVRIARDREAKVRDAGELMKA